MGMFGTSALSHGPRRLGWLRPILLIGCQFAFAGAAVAQDQAALGRSARDNETISFEGSKPDVGQVYKGDLNLFQHNREVYRLLLGRGEAALFELSSQKFDPMLKIMSADGQELLSNDDRAQDERDSSLVFAAPPNRSGIYYLVVTSVDDRGGDYTLTATRRRVRPVEPRAIAAGTIERGRLDEQSALRIEDQRIYSSYYFDAAADERVLISGRASDVPLSLELVHEGKVVRASTGAASFDRLLTHQVTVNGRYQINVLARADSKGDFELQFIKLPKAKPAGAPVAVTIGESASGEFAADSPVISPTGNRPYSLFEISGTAGDSVGLWATTGRFTAPGAADPYPLSLEVGADTPVGFAAVPTRPLPSEHVPGSRRIEVKFARSGTLLVRVAGSTGALGSFTLATQRLTAGSGTAASAKPQ